MACDICGKTGTSLNNLRDCFQTKDIKSICRDCENIVNPTRDKIWMMANQMHMTLLQRFITEMKLKFTG